MDSIFTCVGGIMDGQYIYLCRGHCGTYGPISLNSLERDLNSIGAIRGTKSHFETIKITPKTVCVRVAPSQSPIELTLDNDPLFKNQLFP